MNPDLKKIATSVFLKFEKSGRGLFTHGKSQWFFHVFMAVSSFSKIQGAHGWLSAIRRLSDPVKINNSFGSGSTDSNTKKTNTCLNIWLFTNSDSEPLNPGGQIIKSLK
jgi:hypothetical protein